MAIVTTLSATSHEEELLLADEDEEVGTESSDFPSTSLRGTSRFLAEKPRATMTCDKYPRVCSAKGSPGPDCCKKNCVNVMTDKLNCGMCGKKCKYSEICCKGFPTSFSLHIHLQQFLLSLSLSLSLYIYIYIYIFMDKGWSLTLDSDPLGFFMTKPSTFNLTPRFNHHNKPRNMFSGMEFPVNLNHREEQATTQSFDDNRTVVDEVDFFSDKNKCNDNLDSDIASITVKEENSPGKAAVNTGLRLLTANTGSDQSTVDDGISSNAEHKRAKNERLKGMPTQVSNNYGALQGHLVTLMQQQQQQESLRAQSPHEPEVIFTLFLNCLAIPH
ncbi:hypothetical protein F0562_014382 [Nyssa sinensis]|uniref:Stigma-specific STIG1-like protein 1 n=1 Tax=Nyssa sinensis TaxID=561372 RepID=A0A5J4ZQY2_9ASTE|nr:hypothetical protein F0562_014382 [Nyssa sinensis]